jgi:glycosyltransferase involved in cell wall biosynthesis
MRPGRRPLVSVTMPVYNRPGYLAEAIASVVAQTYPRIELIIVDDGSTDETRDVLATHADAAVLLRQAHAGQAAARNRGFGAAHGE